MNQELPDASGVWQVYSRSRCLRRGCPACLDGAVVVKQECDERIEFPAARYFLCTGNPDSHLKIF
jgi:hypothetical protein